MKQKSFYKHLHVHVGVNSTFGYIDDLVSICNDNFHSYVDFIYPCGFEIKDIKKSYTSASYLYLVDILEICYVLKRQQ